LEEIEKGELVNFEINPGSRPSVRSAKRTSEAKCGIAMNEAPKELLRRAKRRSALLWGANLRSRHCEEHRRIRSYNDLWERQISI